MLPRSMLLMLLAIVIAVGMGQVVNAEFVSDNLMLNLDAADVDGAGTGAADATGTGWSDLSGATVYDGTLMGNDWTVAGVGNGTLASPYAMQFNGSNDYVDIAFMGIDENSLSYEIWLKTDPAVGMDNGSTRGVVFGEYPASGSNHRGMVQFTGPNTTWLTEGAQFDHFRPSAGAVNTAFFDCPIDEWYQFVATKDGDQVSMYVNGLLLPADLSGNPFPVTTTEVYEGDAVELTWLGARANNSSPYHPFMGEIGLVRVYGDVLTGQEVAQNYANDAATFVPEPHSLLLIASGLLALLWIRRRRSIVRLSE